MIKLLYKRTRPQLTMNMLSTVPNR